MTFLNFLNLSSHKENSSSYKNKTFISSPTNVKPELAQELLKFVNPVTLSSTDLEGRTIQLWSYNSELVASVVKDGKITLIPGDSVCNSLHPSERGRDLLKLLQAGSLKKWQFAYVRGRISVWPHLIAAGKDGQSDWKPPIFPQEKQKLFHIFNKRGKEGHFTKDTPQNREYILRATRSPHNIVARTSNGETLYMQTQHDGSQSWAKVSNRGIIKSGGRNERPKTWQQMGARTIDFYTSFRFQQQFGKTPATKQFHQTLQQTHLTKSYNGSHPNRPVAARGATSGQIGGVGHKLGMIEGLFDHPEALFEREHYFMVPLEGENVPFSERELKQILRELAIGIYAHEAVPFFSLELRAHHKIPRQCLAPSAGSFHRCSASRAHKGLFASSALNWPYHKNLSIESSFMMRSHQDGHLLLVMDAAA